MMAAPRLFWFANMPVPIFLRLLRVWALAQLGAAAMWHGTQAQLPLLRQCHGP